MGEQPLQEVERQSRWLLRWLWDDAPALPDRLMDPLVRFVAWVGCKRQGHAPYLEMDNRSFVCAYCHRLLGVREEAER